MMLAMHQQNVCSVLDLRYVCVACQNCKTKVIIDLEEFATLLNKHRTAALAQDKPVCPGCDQEYDSAVKPGLRAVRTAFELLRPISDRITFLGEPENAISSNQ